MLSYSPIVNDFRLNDLISLAGRSFDLGATWLTTRPISVSGFVHADPGGGDFDLLEPGTWGAAFPAAGGGVIGALNYRGVLIGSLWLKAQSPNVGPNTYTVNLKSRASSPTNGGAIQNQSVSLMIENIGAPAAGPGLYLDLCAFTYLNIVATNDLMLWFNFVGWSVS